MYKVKRTDAFNDWLHGLKDGPTHRRLLVRLRKLTLGNLGDVHSVGGGVFEMREHFGAGWRMYYVQRGNNFIVMLGGGSKSTQASDIAAAKRFASNLEN